MKLLLKISFLLILSAADICAQCPPTNVTATISGLYSLDLNPAPGSVIYVTSSGTITGNINLNNVSLHNCGAILSQKIKMRQSIHNHQYIFENNGTMKCDTISLDSLGHFHNNDTIFCNQLILNYGSSVDNNWVIEANRIETKKGSNLNSMGLLRTNYLIFTDPLTQFYNLYFSKVSVRKLFEVDSASSVSGMLNLCVDSCFINKGSILCNVLPTWSPSIRVNGLSHNSGQLSNLDFCDHSSQSAGMLDVNSGTLSNVTLCTSQQFICDFGYTSIKSNTKSTKSAIIYPNPTFNTLYILTENHEFDNSLIEVINNLGQTVLKQRFSESISVAPLSPGYYTLLIFTAGGQFHSKFVKN